jgi:hypothetical protein
MCDSGGPTIIPEGIAGAVDGTIVFAHIAWSVDSSKVAAFVVNGYSEASGSLSISHQIKGALRGVGGVGARFNS